MWPLPPQFPLCRNCRKPGKGSQETVTTDHIGGQQEMYYRLLTFQSRHLHLWTWPQDYLIFFIARDIWDRRAEDFLCHPFISYQVLCNVSLRCQLDCVLATSDNGISWYQLTQLPSVPAAGLVFTGGRCWPLTMLRVVTLGPGVIGHNILIGSHHFMRQYPQSV